ncbi:DUF6249 domain-containing protein [Asticcacaulis solisilvae]|uniref:DUF6249 domain-containing protein n=1 Tax=Asticcacaulis solisilvae TaxID=1217274 RepID=UPI003FD73F63
MDIGILVPIISVVMVFGMPIAIVFIVQMNKARNNAELQKTLRMSIEKGQPLPPEFVESIQRSVPKAKNPMNDVRAGLVLLAVAAGLAVMDYMSHDFIFGHLAGVAAIPGFIGLALLILGIVGLNTRKPN